MRAAEERPALPQREAGLRGEEEEEETRGGEGMNEKRKNPKATCAPRTANRLLRRERMMSRWEPLVESALMMTLRARGGGCVSAVSCHFYILQSGGVSRYAPHLYEIHGCVKHPLRHPSVVIK